MHYEIPRFHSQSPENKHLTHFFPNMQFFQKSSNLSVTSSAPRRNTKQTFAEAKQPTQITCSPVPKKIDPILPCFFFHYSLQFHLKIQEIIHTSNILKPAGWRKHLCHFVSPEDSLNWLIFAFVDTGLHALGFNVLCSSFP